MHDKVSPILRRYHLVKLLERLCELQQESSRVLCQQEPKKLEYWLCCLWTKRLASGTQSKPLRSIEKAQHRIFAQILDLLHEHRGDVLSKLSEVVSESIFNSPLGAPGAPSFVFDDDDEQDQLYKALYDSPALVGSFRLQSI
jgi:hypothetical protein